MSVSVNNGSLEFTSILNNSDFQAKSLQDIKLIQLRLQLTGDTTGIAKYDAAFKAQAEQEKQIRAELNKLLEDTKVKTQELTQQMQEPVKTLFIEAAADVATYNENLSSGASIITSMNAELQDLQFEQLRLNASYEEGVITLSQYEQKMLENAEAQRTVRNNIQSTTDSMTALADVEIEAAVVTETSTKATVRQNTVIAETVGLIEELQVAIKSLKADQVAIIDPKKLAESNARLQEMELELQRLKNIGRQGFDELGNAIPVEQTSRFSNAISRATNLSNIGATVISRLSRQIIGLGVGMLSFAIGAKAIEAVVNFFAQMISYTSRLDLLKAKISAFNEVNSNAAKAAGEQAASLQILYKAATDVNNTMEDRIKFANELKALYPNSFANSTNQAILNGKEADSYRVLTQQIIAQAQAKAVADKIAANAVIIANANIQKQKITNAKSNEISQAKKHGVEFSTGEAADAVINTDISVEDQIKAANNRAAFAVKEQDQIIAQAQQVNDFLTTFAGGTAKVANALNNSSKLIQKPLENFDAIVKAAGDKADFVNLKSALQAKLDNLAPDDKQIATYQDKIRKVEEILKKYDPKINDGKSAANADAESLKARLALLNSIADAVKAVNRTTLDSDQAALQAIADKFDQLRSKVSVFNANPKNKNHKIGNNVVTQLNAAEVQATTDQSNLNENGFIAKDIEEKKKIYTDYEAYRLKVGNKIADAEYEDLLRSGKDFETYLNNIKKASEADENKGTSPIQARIQNIKIQIAAEKELRHKAYTENLNTILENTKTSDSVRLAIEKKYQDDVLTLALDNNVKDASARIAILKQNRDIALDQAKTLAFNQTKIAIDAAENLFNLTETQLKAHVKKLKTELDADSKKSNNDPTKLTPAQRSLIESAVNSSKQVELNADKTYQAFQGIATYAGAAASAFDKLAQSLQEVNPGLADTLSTLSQLSSTVSDIGSLGASIASGNVVGVISGVASVAGDIIGIFNAGKKSAAESAAEIARYQDSLITGQIIYNELIRDQARTQDDISKLSINELNAREKLLKIQTSQAQADFNTLLSKIQAGGAQITGEHTEKYGGVLGIGRKTKVVQDLAGLGGTGYDDLLKLYTEGKLTDSTKVWFEQLQKVHDEMGSIDDATKQVRDQLNQALTGTTADSISNAIIDGFKAGKRSAADFAGDFQALMQNAALSVFESNYLKGKIETFYQQFADASNAPGGLTASSIATLKASYNKIITDAGTQVSNLQSVLGTSLTTGSSTSSLSGSIKAGITEDTASILAGTLKGIQLGVYDTNRILQGQGLTLGQLSLIAQTQLSVAVKIEANTKRTADNSDNLPFMLSELQGINQNSKGSLGVDLRAAGYYGY